MKKRKKDVKMNKRQFAINKCNLESIFKMEISLLFQIVKLMISLIYQELFIKIQMMER